MAEALLVTTVQATTYWVIHNRQQETKIELKNLILEMISRGLNRTSLEFTLLLPPYLEALKILSVTASGNVIILAIFFNQLF